MSGTNITGKPHQIILWKNRATRLKSFTGKGYSEKSPFRLKIKNNNIFPETLYSIDFQMVTCAKSLCWQGLQPAGMR